MDSVLRPLSLLFLGFSSIALILINISFCHGNSNNNPICIESEKDALLRFKQDLEDPSNRLSSWSVEEEDCCRWAGVVCNNVTGHVQKLLLSRPSVDGPTTMAGIEASDRSRLGGKINPSLLELKYLSHLDLSYNNFKGIQIPKFLGSMKSLRYLDLNMNDFGGMIPHELGNLSSLQYLSISGGYDYAELYSDDLRWLSGLSSLKHLGFYFMNLSGASNWVEMINMLPSLSELHLSACELVDIPSVLLPDQTSNLTSLSVLDISYNDFNSSIPEWVFSLGSLTYFDLRENSFHGPIPTGLLNLTKLRYLNCYNNQDFGPSTIPIWLFNFSHLEFLGLGGCSMQGLIPDAIGNLSSATQLDFTNNELEGPLPRSIGNLCNLRTLVLRRNKLEGEVFERLSGCISHSLWSLQLDGNNFSGGLTNQLGLFKNLAYLSLAGNSISGPIPQSVGSLSSLRSLRIGSNQLNGTLPESLAHLTNLEELDLSRNLLEGVVSEVHFANLTNLKSLIASDNSLILKVSPNWIPPFHLADIELRSWDLGPQFPAWLKSQKDFETLDLSSTRISDSIPTWFWNVSSHINLLNLSYNQIRGEIPYIINVSSTYAMFYLRSNQFSGPLPVISSYVTELDLSNNLFSGNISHFLCNSVDERNQLKILHLGDNLLSGEIPDCWMNWPSLVAINFGNNHLTGNIPSSIGHLHNLQSLHLWNNSLLGELPHSLQNCTNLITLVLGLNEFEGSIPAWIGSTLLSLRFLILRSNKFKGDIPRELCGLSSLQIMDLANNSLSGMIPPCVNHFEAMATKRDTKEVISYSFYWGAFLENAFARAKGTELQYDTILSLVAILDLSSNKLSGEVPDELTSLLGLMSLSLSDNHLTGKLPGKIGNMESLESLDLSRNQLSGEIPPSMSSMTFLSYLNLSYNNLSGKIPLSTQFQGFNASSFVGNKLCGLPLTVNCSGGGEAEAPPPTENGGDEVEWPFYVSMVLGFVASFWAVVGPLLFSRSWRRSYFLLVDRIWHNLCASFRKYC